MYRTNSATGEPIADFETETPSLVRNYFLESSNVQIVDEMVKLITAQEHMNLTQRPSQHRMRCCRQLTISEDRVAASVCQEALADEN